MLSDLFLESVLSEVIKFGFGVRTMTDVGTGAVATGYRPPNRDCLYTTRSLSLPLLTPRLQTNRPGGAHQPPGTNEQVNRIAKKRAGYLQSSGRQIEKSSQRQKSPTPSAS